jgi:hypothetical protein
MKPPSGEGWRFLFVQRSSCLGIGQSFLVRVDTLLLEVMRFSKLKALEVMVKV